MQGGSGSWGPPVRTRRAGPVLWTRRSVAIASVQIFRRIRDPEAAPRHAAVAAVADDVLGPMLCVDLARCGLRRLFDALLRYGVEELALVGPGDDQRPVVGVPARPAL